MALMISYMMSPFVLIDSPFSLGKDGSKHARDFEQAGFFSIPFGGIGSDWQECQQWCMDAYGNRYCWTGRTFWFLTEQDAMWFALRWA